MRQVVYTAVVNNIDSLCRPAVVEPALYYVVFSDNADLDPPAPWQRRSLATSQRSARMTARWHKLHPHLLFPDYDVSLYVDGNVFLKSSVAGLADIVAAGPSIALFHHPERQCAYDEAEVVKRHRLDDELVVDAQVAYYRQHGFPARAGLFTSTVMVRRHNDEDLIGFHEAWWRQLKSFSHRDQLSLNFMLARHKIPVRVLPGNNDDNSWFAVAPHRHHRPGTARLGHETPVDEIDWLREFAIRTARRQTLRFMPSLNLWLLRLGWYAKEPLRWLKRWFLRRIWRPPAP